MTAESLVKSAAARSRRMPANSEKNTSGATTIFSTDRKSVFSNAISSASEPPSTRLNSQPSTAAASTNANRYLCMNIPCGA